MKKKLLFILPSFGIGGTTVSTKNLILTLNHEGYDMYVMPMKDEGDLRAMFDDVKQIKSPFVVSSLSYGSWHDQKGFFGKLFCAVLRLVGKSHKFKTLLLSHSANNIMKANHFDTVIACQEGMATRFVSCFECDNKVAWIRCDYERYAKTLKSQRQEDEIYMGFNSIICVSEITSENFVRIYPEFKSKTFSINNPQSSKYILEQSENNDGDDRFVKDGFTLLSIGRIDPVKRFTFIPKIASELLQKGLQFRWYIVGGGNETEYGKIIAEINKYNVQNNVVCLGLKTNPHFYIGHSDLLVCLSSSEACPRVINEAKVLHVPVVSADFATAKEYIENEKNGLICPIDLVTENIYKILIDNELRNKILDNIQSFQFDNSTILSQLEEIL